MLLIMDSFSTMFLMNGSILSLNFSYGFSDKKFKTDFSLQYLLGDYRTTEINSNAFNKIKILFGESDNYQ